MNFQYDESAAVAADSGGKYLTESAVVRCRIETAKWIHSQSSNAEALELNVTTEAGQQVNFLTIWHKKADGSANDIGHKQINALMGVTGVRNLSQSLRGNDRICPELHSKPVMLALERENYMKGDGTDGFKFNIKAFMSPQSGKTVAEHVNGEPAKSVEYWRERFAKNPTGNQPQQSAQSAPAAQGIDDGGFDSDIPF